MPWGLFACFICFLSGPSSKTHMENFLTSSTWAFFTFCSMCMLQRSPLPDTFSVASEVLHLLYPSCSSCNQQTHPLFFFFIPTWGLFHFLSLFLYCEPIILVFLPHTVCVALPSVPASLFHPNSLGFWHRAWYELDW